MTPGQNAPRSGPGGARRWALWSLAACNAINAGFLAFDERMWAPELLSGAALLAGGLAYVAAVPLVWRDQPGGHRLCLVVIPLASVVVVGDNFSAFGSTPNAWTYWLNWAFLAVQVPLAAACTSWLREVRAQNP